MSDYPQSTAPGCLTLALLGILPSFPADPSLRSGPGCVAEAGIPQNPCCCVFPSHTSTFSSSPCSRHGVGKGEVTSASSGLFALSGRLE